MWICGTFLMIIFIGFLLAHTDAEDFAVGVVFLGLFFFVISLVAWCGVYYGDQSGIQQFNSVKVSLQNARLKGNVLENAALQQKVIEQNEWLAGEKYYKENTIFGQFMPDAIEQLKPLE